MRRSRRNSNGVKVGGGRLKESDKGAPINPVSIVAQFPEGGSTVSFNRDALAADALRSKG